MLSAILVQKGFVFKMSGKRKQLSNDIKKRYRRHEQKWENKRNVSIGHGCPRDDNRKLWSDRSENGLGRMGHNTCIKQPYQVSSQSLLRFLRKA